MEALEKLGAEMYRRVWLSWRSTLIGVAAGMAVEAINSIVLPYLNASPQPWAHLLASVVALAGASLKSKALAPAPSVQTDMLKVLVLGAGLALAGASRADELQPPPAPPLGGTFLAGGFGRVNYGPALLPGMLALDLSNGNVDAVQIGGLAYGIMAWSDRPYSVGLSVFLSAQTGAPGTIGFGGVLTFFKYAAVGVRRSITGGDGVTQVVFGPAIPL